MNEINLKNFNEEITNTEKIVLVDFYATWCGPCKMIAPIIEEIAEEYNDKIKVCKVNIDDNRDIALKYDIESIPTLMFFKEGNELSKNVGFHTKSELKEIINNLL